MRPVIMLFAKAPIAGRVKTRLSPVMTPEDAARLHKAFVFDTLESLNDLADTQLWSDVHHPDWPADHLQSPGDLGQRILHALESALSEGRPRAMVIGADSPTLPPGAIRQVLEADADVALGPTEDGGYWSIAARRVHPRMFAGVEWSTERTLAQTLAAAQVCGLSTALGPRWWDVDTPEDLERLRRETALPRYTRQALNGIP